MADKLGREAEAAGKRADAYLDTVKRLEPNITQIDADTYYASAAISLKRLADNSDRIVKLLEIIVGTSSRDVYKDLFS